jgi:hypothetical protein
MHHSPNSLINGFDLLVDGFSVGVMSSVYAGSSDNEDGESRDQLSFYVLIEHEVTGARWRSRTAFSTEDMSREACEEKAELFCVLVQRYMARGMRPDVSSKWLVTYPRYGSPSYGRGECDLEDEARAVGDECGEREEGRFRGEVGL